MIRRSAPAARWLALAGPPPDAVAAALLGEPGAGPSLAQALSAGASGRALAEAVGSALARLHGAGFVHGDLHARNVLLGQDGPVFVDLRAARRSGSRRARLRDVAALERSLAHIGLAALGIRAPEPLAFLERRRFGLPFASVLVQEDLCPALRADAPGPEIDPSERLGALVRLALALHGGGAAHTDFTAGNLLLTRERDGLVAYAVDLEDVRFPRRLRDASRVRALAQLNGSLPDWIPDAQRRRALRRYATWLPFRAPIQWVEGRVALESLARRHHWSGRGCGRGAGAGLRRSRS